MAGPSEEADFTYQVQQFNFCGESIDASLRKLLAKVRLPKEAQQIDRAMEDFAARYFECNPTLIDKPDAHNKNVKQKMDKDTFIRRTKIIEGGEGVPAEILDIMYDNIVLSEFTYAKDINTRPERSNSWFSKLLSDTSTTATNPSGDNSNTTSNQSNVTFADLAPKLEQLMPAENSFNYKRNILKPIPIMDIHFSLLTAKPLCLSGVRSRHGNNTDSKNNNTFTIRVAKAGILDRKHDLLPSGKRATARSWRPFGIILSGSQIIFFSDMSSYQAWLEEEESMAKRPPRRNSSVPHSVSSLTASASNLSLNNATITSTTSFYTNDSGTIPALLSTRKVHLQPVQIISLSYAVCIYDENYTKYPHVFRLILGDGQQFLLRASSDQEMDDWMLKINYAASLKTTGVGVKSFRRRGHDVAQSPDTRYETERQKRQEEAREKIQELSDRIEEQIRLLDRELQLRRNLMVLIPVQKSTKDRLISFADMVGERIKHKRIELQRLECYRDYLESELAWCSSPQQQQQQQQQERKMSLPAHLTSSKALKGINESFRSLSNLLFTPSSTSTSTTSNSSTSTNISNVVSIHSPNKSDEEDNHTNPDTNDETQIPSVSFPKLVIDKSDSPKKPIDLERVMRRRSQSNPILPNNKKLLLLQPPKVNQRERSGSEASSIKEEEDDNISVIIINESEGIELPHSIDTLRK
ncbi:hypothetical protein G6F60_003552 [Rhizopus arrhizus]|nr:hypothetical protein G6F24_007509 [Rhizopus arrhizus]KAG0912844.1 hypothetical protein G6F33_005708 [Rhizopus arrhizus]KAG1384030.1 hypothetical protein G6F61_000818 [Rhizopus arrhizus]KAG1405540.1 hypothetical protein G6F60_003552 [Rhizopus arrhizus]